MTGLHLLDCYNALVTSSRLELAATFRAEAKSVLQTWLSGNPLQEWATFGFIVILIFNIVYTILQPDLYIIIILVMIAVCWAAIIQFRILPGVRRKHRATYEKWDQPLRDHFRGVLTSHGLLVQALTADNPPILRKYKTICWLDIILSFWNRPNKSGRSRQYYRMCCLAKYYPMICKDLGIEGFPAGETTAATARIAQRLGWKYEMCESIVKSVMADLLETTETGNAEA